MSGIAKPMAASSTSLTPSASIPVEQVLAYNDCSVPAIANYPAQYQLAFTLFDKTCIMVRYSTAALKNTALAAFKTAFSTNF